MILSINIWGRRLGEVCDFRLLEMKNDVLLEEYNLQAD